jgi:hypothetical protein
LDRPAVAVRYLADDGEPEAGAGHGPGQRRAVEAVEHVRQVIGRNAGAVIAHGELAGHQRDLHHSARRPELGRVVQQVPDRDLEPLGAADDLARLEPGREDGPGPVPPGGRQRRGDHLFEPDIFVRAGDRLAPGELGDVADQLAELRDLSHHPVEHLLALGCGQAGIAGQQLGVDAQARQRSTELVAGVADQLPLIGQRPLKRAEHRVERGRQPAELVGAIHLDPAGRVPSLGHLLGDRGQPAHRGQPAPRHGPPRQCGQPDPDPAEQGQRRPHAGHLGIHRVERDGQLDGQARSQRRGQDQGTDSVQGGVAIVGPALAGRHLFRSGIRGQQAAVAGRRPHRAVSRHHLSIGSGRTEPVRVRRHPSGGHAAVEVPGLPVDHRRLRPQFLP